MSFRYHPDAADELYQAASFYEDRQEGFGERFLDEVESAVALLADHPLAGAAWDHPELDAPARRFPLRVFPYVLFYVVQPSHLIVAVAHAHRLPGYWLERTRRP